MTHEPFDDAYVRIERARKHLSEVKTIIEDTRKGKVTFAAQQELDPQGSLPILKFRKVFDKMLREAIGDVIQQLRTALNYMVCDLGEIDSAVSRS